jgi:hypothetical protein
MAGTLAENATAEEKTAHDKLLKRLQRLNTPAEVAKALREQDKLISSGQLKKPLAANATPEQVAAWRAENGIPESPDKYDLTMPDGLVFGDADKPVIDRLVKDLHAINATPEVVKQTLRSYNAIKSEAERMAGERNKQASRALENELRAEWGIDYDNNTDGITAMLVQQGGEEYEEFIFNLRSPDGTKAMNDPRLVRALAQEARERGFVAGTVVGSGGDIGKGVEDQIAEIDKMMFNEDGSKNPAYWHSEKQQKRYSDLLEARKRQSK